MLRFTGPSETLRNPPTSLDYGSAFYHHEPLYSRFPAPLRSADAPIQLNPLIDKLSGFLQLDSAEIAALTSLTRNPRRFAAEHTLIHEGVATNHICLVVEGLACRFKMLAGGGRQILGYLIPGDLCDVHFTLFNRPDHGVMLLSDSQIVQIPIATLAQMIAFYPNIGRALALAGLVDAATLREWLLNVGRRDAIEKLSHFFCEMAVRFRAIGRVSDDGSFDLPVNQTTLADTVGLTAVHINRVLQRLRGDGLIRLRHRRLTILDLARLTAIAGFDEYYLQTCRHRD